MSSNGYIKKIKKFPHPWNTFRLDEPFKHEFEGYPKEQFEIRKLIYKHFPNQPSITLGSLPPIISPIFWEANSGVNREEILSFKWKGECIKETTYENQLSMYSFWKNIIKISLVNLSSYHYSLEETFKNSNYTEKEIDLSIQRRINAIDLFIDSISKGNWNKLLLAVPNDHISTKDISFTITPNLDITLHRNEGLGKHIGKFEYYPTENDIIKKIWLKRWKEVIDIYSKHRADFPRYLSHPEDIPLFKEECALFNINSLRLIKQSLINAKNRNKNNFVNPNFLKKANVNKIDIVVYIALNEEFNYIIDQIGIELAPEELKDISITCYHGTLISEQTQKEIKVLFVPSGKMGNTRSSGVMSSILGIYKPKSVIVIGIAGSLDNDLYPGDIFIPDTVNEYLANSAATGKRNWSFQISGNHFNSTPKLINRFQNFRHTKKEYYQKWKNNSIDSFSSIVGEDLYLKLKEKDIDIKKECSLVVGDDKVLASGPAVGKGEAFVKWLKTKVDRKVSAIEMESAGIYDAVHIRTDKPDIISIRGVSDFADERKEQIEKTAKEKFRLLAIKNCISLLETAIVAGVFEE